MEGRERLSLLEWIFLPNPVLAFMLQHGTYLPSSSPSLRRPPPDRERGRGHDEICAQKPPENYPVKIAIADENERVGRRGRLGPLL